MRNMRGMLPASTLIYMLILVCGVVAAQLKEAPDLKLLVSAQDPKHRPHDSTLPSECGRLSKEAGNSFIDYDYLVSCTALRHSPVLARAVLGAILAFLLYLLSSTADSFFCPVLQAIVERYRIPPDVAGVTFLSFGNGSPDVFSNIAAFATATSRLGVASILGGGLLVTTVIVASVGLASQGQTQLVPRKYVRDVAFYLLSVIYFCAVFFDGAVNLAEALGFLVIYAAYVTVVFLDASNAVYAAPEAYITSSDTVTVALSGVPVSPCSSNSSSVSDIEPTAYGVFRLPNYASVSDSDQSDSSLISIVSAPALLQRWSLAPSPRAQLFANAHDEHLPLLQNFPPTRMKRPASVCTSMLRHRRRRRSRSVWEAASQGSDFDLTAKRWTRPYHLLSGIEEASGSLDTEEMLDMEAQHDGEDGAVTPSGESTSEVESQQPPQSSSCIINWSSRWFDLFHRIVLGPIQFATTFVRRMTIPLVDEDTWDKGFAIMCPPCAVLMIGISVFHANLLEDLQFFLVVVFVGGAGSAYVLATASEYTPPQGIHLAPYLCLAFAMSVIWIMNIAKEVLAVLVVLGNMLGISNAVLGVSVLAWGNSVGDLVSNTAIARDGFPTMAFAGCFAGPMFNLLIGVGIALTISVICHGPFYMGEPTPLVYLGFFALFASLALNLIGVVRDGYQYRPRLCYLLLALYACSAAISIGIIVCIDDD